MRLKQIKFNPYTTLVLALFLTILPASCITLPSPPPPSPGTGTAGQPSAAPETAQPTQPAQPQGYVVHPFELRVFQLTNIERVNHGLQPLIWNDTLGSLARDHSLDMMRNNFMSHTGSNGSSMSNRITESGIRSTRRAENVAAGQTTPEAVVISWMNSPGHRANILNPSLTHLGVGFAERNNSARFPTYWTQKFITQ